MDVSIERLANLGWGASQDYTPIAKALTLRLGDYGTAVTNLEVRVYIPKKENEPRFLDFLSEAGPLPTIRFYRKREKIVISYLADSNEPRDKGVDWGAGVCNRVMPQLLQALRLVETRIKPSDDFDLPRFLQDAEQFLTKGFSSEQEIDEINQLYAARDTH